MIKPLNAILLSSTIGAEEIFNMSISDIVNVIIALIILIGLVDKGIKWFKDKKMETYNDQNEHVRLESTVDADHNKIEELEKQLEEMKKFQKNISTGLVEILRSDLMENHDRYMARKPYPCMTKYERLMQITLYNTFISLKRDSVIDGFHAELLELPVVDTLPQVQVIHNTNDNQR